MMIKTSESEFDFLKEWNKLDPLLNSEQKASHLSKLSFLKKTALSIRLDLEKQERPIGQVKMDWDHLLRASCSSKITSLIYEYCQIAFQKRQIIPLNLLVEFLNFADKNHELSDYILPCVGDPGQYLIQQNPDWQYLEETEFCQALNVKESRQKIFLLKRSLHQDPNKTLQFFLDNLSNCTEKEKLVFIDELKLYATKLDFPKIEELLPQLKWSLKLKLYSIYLIMDTNPLGQNTKKYVLQILESKKWNELINVEIFGKINKLDWSIIIGVIPPSWFLNHPNTLSYLDYLKSQDLLHTFAESIQSFKDSVSAAFFCKYIIDQDEFTEHFPLLKLSSVMDYKSFNSCAIYYCKKYEDRMDLEGFLFFIDYFKHFWSDELLHEILHLNKHKTLVKKYNLEVFYHFIPYRINPNSNIEKDIPLSIKDNIQLPLSYNSIINFRRILRK